MKTVKLKVQCTFILPIEMEVPDDYTEHDVHFRIEENSCPATGPVGAKLEELVEQINKDGICWACNHEGKNEIIEIVM